LTHFSSERKVSLRFDDLNFKVKVQYIVAITVVVISRLFESPVPLEVSQKQEGYCKTYTLDIVPFTETFL